MMDPVTTGSNLLWQEPDPPSDKPGNYLVRYDSKRVTGKHGYTVATSRILSRDWDGQRWLGDGPEPSYYRPHFRPAPRNPGEAAPEPVRTSEEQERLEEEKAKVLDGIKQRSSDKGQTSPEIRAKISAAVKAANERRKAAAQGKKP
jgi:hypothetical protein